VYDVWRTGDLFAAMTASSSGAVLAGLSHWLVLSQLSARCEMRTSCVFVFRFCELPQN